MIITGKLPETFLRISHNDLRCLKSIPLFQCPLKMIWMDSHHHTGLSDLIHLCLKYKVSTVCQRIAVAVSMCLFRIAVAEDDKWIMVVAGSSPDTSHRPVSVTQMVSFHLTLHGMSAVKMNCIQFPVFKVHFHGHCFLYGNSFCACIFQAYCPGDHIEFRKYSIKKVHLQPAGMICQNDLQSLCFLFSSEHGRKSPEAVFARSDLIKFEFQIRSITSICLNSLQAIDPVIPVSVGCVFLWQSIQGKCPVPSRFIRIPGKTSVCTHDPVCNQCISHRTSIIKMNQGIILPDLHLIRAVFCSQFKYFLFFVISDPFHLLYLSCYFLLNQAGF